MIPPAVAAEAQRLTTAWRTALDKSQRTSTARADLAEQTAYDRLVDYVEANDLNDSEHDPRASA
jgi:hypothetical protein